MIAGKDAPTFGEAKNSWLTGTAAWNYYAITQWILGIRTSLDGLEIAPVIPQNWPGFTASAYSAASLIHQHRTQRAGNSIALTVDGEPIAGNVVPSHRRAHRGEGRWSLELVSSAKVAPFETVPATVFVAEVVDRLSWRRLRRQSAFGLTNIRTCHKTKQVPGELHYVADQRYDTMHYRRCGTSGIRLPAISLGLWHNFGGVDTFENSRAMVRRAFDLGITHFDLANNYGPPPGTAESNFGEILRLDLKPYRDELIISTKAGYGHVARSLWRLGFAQISARQPRSEPHAHGPGVCRHLLFASARSRDAC